MTGICNQQTFKYQSCTCEGPELGHYCVCRLPGTVDTDIYTFAFWVYRVSSWFQTISTSVKWQYLKWLPIFRQLVCFFICYMKHFAYVPQRLRWFYSDDGGWLILLFFLEIANYEGFDICYYIGIIVLNFYWLCVDISTSWRDSWK